MTGADLAIAGVVLLSALIGLSRGLVREVLSLAIWLIALVLALAFMRPLAAELRFVGDDATVRQAVAFILIFIATLLAGGGVQWLIARLIETTGLSGTDRLLGFVFGGARGALVSLVALMLLRPFAADYGWWQASSLIPVLGAFEEDVLRVANLATRAGTEAARELVDER